MSEGRCHAIAVKIPVGNIVTCATPLTPLDPFHFEHKGNLFLKNFIPHTEKGNVTSTDAALQLPSERIIII